jgi:hypothetical protein
MTFVSRVSAGLLKGGLNTAQPYWTQTMLRRIHTIYLGGHTWYARESLKKMLIAITQFEATCINCITWEHFSKIALAIGP